MNDRKERFVYKQGDLKRVTNQCKDCCFYTKQPLSCEKYAKIPNGTRSGKIECPFKSKS